MCFPCSTYQPTTFEKVVISLTVSGFHQMINTSLCYMTEDTRTPAVYIQTKLTEAVVDSWVWGICPYRQPDRDYLGWGDKGTRGNLIKLSPMLQLRHSSLEIIYIYSWIHPILAIHLGTKASELIYLIEIHMMTKENIFKVVKHRLI